MSTNPVPHPTPPDLKSRMAATYDALAQTYAKHFVQPADPRRLKHLNTVLTLLQEAVKDSKEEPAKVLELGCGAGIPVTKALLEHAAPKLHVTANDLSPVQISLARANLGTYEAEGRLVLHEGDMHALTCEPSSFSAIVAFHSLIHLPRTEQTSLLAPIAAWLKPGGLFLANFATDEIESVVDPTWLGEEKGWVYWSSWGEEGSVRMVEEAGLEVLAREVSADEGDARFVWVLARKKGE
ncbi:S-adenosyl-L-methionine-dependent methyltransferase [Lentithecium fluviatile CBS 122367]|uniref:S-adenosyl-L-methionine-dependent methyltransferase n=1 Tax=Lentithecium fluviatile CBS 122367 TaxID=1168545 RepID=A0A6G1JH96_9PLEO|nr:S-adenosyl-L-methionine-dependent methyltransferase [Lentithecium fluviatile CBS 122367]